jgi:hypothetical protein
LAAGCWGLPASSCPQNVRARISLIDESFETLRERIRMGNVGGRAPRPRRGWLTRRIASTERKNMRGTHMPVKHIVPRLTWRDLGTGAAGRGSSCPRMSGVTHRQIGESFKNAARKHSRGQRRRPEYLRREEGGRWGGSQAQKAYARHAYACKAYRSEADLAGSGTHSHGRRWRPSTSAEKRMADGWIASTEGICAVSICL